MKRLFVLVCMFASLTVFVGCNNSSKETDNSDVNADTIANDSDDGVFEGEIFKEYESVDLGLPSGTLWATCNLGSEDETNEYGNFFAWGEIKSKTNFADEKYDYKMLDNYDDADYEITDIAGYREFDAATANWGIEWCLPTEEQWRELIENCEWEWSSCGNAMGYMVTGPNGKIIFLPAAGTTEEVGLDEYGCYMSSSLNTDSKQNAMSLLFNTDKVFIEDSNLRSEAFSVRPVRM